MLNALKHTFESQCYAAARGIHIDNSYFKHLTHSDHFIWRGDVFVAQLGYVYETVLLKSKIHKDSECRDIVHFAGQLLSDMQIVDFLDRLTPLCHCLRVGLAQAFPVL